MERTHARRVWQGSATRLAPAHGGLAARRRAAGIGWMALTLLLGGCQGILDPRGPVGDADRLILLDALAIMLVVVVPTIALTLAFAWWFRAGNARARYLPGWAYSGRLEALVWSIPALIVMFLGGVTWIGAHQLDPYQRLAGPSAAEEIQVISLDWKWLFIYPGEGIASVNEAVVPVGIPLHFSLTSATVMNSFFVPQLGSQIYTMPGMTSQLNLLAREAGEYRGISAQFSGDGFSDMHFEVRAVDAPQFSAWVAGARARPAVLDARAYAGLLRPEVLARPITFGRVAARFFADALHQGSGAVAAEMPAPAGADAGR